MLHLNEYFKLLVGLLAVMGWGTALFLTRRRGEVIRLLRTGQPAWMPSEATCIGVHFSVDAAAPVARQFAPSGSGARRGGTACVR